MYLVEAAGIEPAGYVAIRGRQNAFDDYQITR